MKRYSLIFLFTSLIFADQLSKYLIRSSGGFYICNKSLAFGLNLKNNSLLIVLALLVLLIFVNLKFKGQNAIRQPAEKIQEYFPFLFILSGGLSNIFDRLRLGCVVDFIDLKFWPVFNLADSFVVLGVIMLIMENVNLKMKNDKSKCKSR